MGFPGLVVRAGVIVGFLLGEGENGVVVGFA